LRFGAIFVDRLTIPTERLMLTLDTPEELLARIEHLSPTDRAEVSPDWLARVRATQKMDPWLLGFAIVHRNDGAVIGACGFKGPPNADGVVEIAYGIDEAQRSRGYATEAARALTAFAFESGLVRIVCAHTKAGNDASRRVLEKCGFIFVGEVIDPEDGQVLRWELIPTRSASEGSSRGS
jgi:RimJ/RimL family protein N-acetyltransferase